MVTAPPMPNKSAWQAVAPSGLQVQADVKFIRWWEVADSVPTEPAGILGRRLIVGNRESQLGGRYATASRTI